MESFLPEVLQVFLQVFLQSRAFSQRSVFSLPVPLLVPGQAQEHTELVSSRAVAPGLS